MATKLSISVLVGAWLLGTSWGFAQVPEPASVVMLDTSDQFHIRPPRAWLIPIRLLQKPLSEWTREQKDQVSRQEIDDFDTMVEEVQALGNSGLCTPGEGIPAIASGMASPPERRVHLSDLVPTQTSVLIGHVVGSEPAWDARNRHIATLVHVKVDQVIRGLDPLAVGNVVTFRRAWGTVTVRGVTLCSEPASKATGPTNLTQPVGERNSQTLLLFGRITPGNQSFLNSAAFEQFQIIDGLVHYPQEVPFYKENKPEPLDLVVGAIRSAR